MLSSYIHTLLSHPLSIGPLLVVCGISMFSNSFPDLNEFMSNIPANRLHPRRLVKHTTVDWVAFSTFWAGVVCMCLVSDTIAACVVLAIATYVLRGHLLFGKKAKAKRIFKLYHRIKMLYPEEREESMCIKTIICYFGWNIDLGDECIKSFFDGDFNLKKADLPKYFLELQLDTILKNKKECRIGDKPNDCTLGYAGIKDVACNIINTFVHPNAYHSFKHDLKTRIIVDRAYYEIINDNGVLRG